MADGAPTFVAECFWPDVEDADLKALDRRVESVIAEIPPDAPVRYLGSILLREDEVVLCQFEGGAEAVRTIAARAQVPFERILATRHSPSTSVRDAALVAHDEKREAHE